MEGIERVLLKMLPNQEGRNKYFIFSMQSKWEQICGANVAKHSKPVRLERKVLYINTDSSVWANHLLMMKQQFINNINRVMTNDPVNDIKFFTGSIENFLQLPKEEKEVKLNFKPLTESEKIFIRQALVNINNQELQKKLAHFRKVCLQRKKALLIENNDMKCKYCGAALIEKNDLCRVCQRYEKEKLRTEIVSILTSEPWLNYNDCQKYVKCDKMLFDSVKNSLKQYYYAKVYNNQSDIREEMTAVMLKTGMQPDKISEQLAQNIIKGLRRKY